MQKPEFVEESADLKQIESQKRESVYSPVKNRESFVDRKLRLLNEQQEPATEEEFGRKSLDCLGIKPRLSRIGQE